MQHNQTDNEHAHATYSVQSSDQAPAMLQDELSVNGLPFTFWRPDLAEMNGTKPWDWNKLEANQKALETLDAILAKEKTPDASEK